jgi:tetratricopeptide (TPR) repeat protein
MTDTEDRALAGNEQEAGRFSPEAVEAELKQRLADAEQERERMLRALVAFYLKTHRPAQAVPCVRRLLATAEAPAEQATRLLTLGQLLEQSEDLSAAAEVYSRGLALEAGPEEVRYLLCNNLGYCLNQLGRFAEAEPLCLAAIALDPERYNAHKNLGVALEGQGRYVEAARCYVQATRRNPGDPRALHHLETMLARHPEVAAAVTELPATLEACRALAGPGRWVQ